MVEVWVWVSVVGQDHGMAAVRLLPFWDNFSGPSDREWSRQSVLSGGLSARPVSGRASEWRQSRSVGLDRTRSGAARRASTRSATGELETSDYNYNTVSTCQQQVLQRTGEWNKATLHLTGSGGSFTNRRPSPSRPASPTPSHPLRCQPCWAARCPCSLPHPWRREAARARSFEARASSAPHRRPCPIR